MASNWRQTYEELKKKKKEIDKVESKKEISNINHKYNNTTNNRTMLDGYGNNNSLQMPNYVKATPVSTAKKEDKKWYQKFFESSSSFNDGYDLGDVTKSVLGTVSDLENKVGKGFVSIFEAPVDIVTRGVQTGLDLVGLDKASEKVKKFADRDLSQELADHYSKNMSLFTTTYDSVSNVQDEYLKFMEEYKSGKDVDAKQTLKNMLKSSKKGVVNLISGNKLGIDDKEKIVEEIENDSISGDTLDKVAELVGYVTGMGVATKGLDKLTGTKTVGNVTTNTAGKTIGTGATLSGGNVGVTVAGRTLNVPTIAVASGMASGLDEAYSKEGVTHGEAWAKGVSSGLIEGVTEGIFGLAGVGGSSFDEIGEAAIKRVSSSFGKQLVNLGVKGTQESLEELASYGFNYLSDNGWIDKLGDADFSSEWDWDEVGEQMALAFISSGAMQGSGVALGTNNAIAEAEKQLGRKLTQQEKADITQQVIDAELNNKQEVQVAEQEIEREEEQVQDPIIEEQVQEEITEAPTTNAVIPPTIEQELTNITNQIDELETMLDTNLNATQQQEILSHIQALEQKYNEILQQGQTQDETVFKTASKQNTPQNVQVEEIGPVQTPNVEQISQPTTQETNSNSLVEVESNTPNVVKSAKTDQKIVEEEIVPTKERRTTNSEVAENLQDKSTQVMTEEEYLASKGYGSMGYSEPGLHKTSARVSQNTRDKQAIQVMEKAEEYDAKREELRQEYQEKVKSGEIRKPTNVEKLLRTAQGHEDNQSVQSARKLLEKRGIDWKTGEKINKENKTPTQEELDNLEDIRKNKSGSEYASAFYDLEKKYGSANLYKGLNNYKSTGKALEEELAPVQESIEDLTKEVKTLTKELKEVKKIAQEGKPLTLEELEDFYKQTDARFRMVEEDIPAPPIPEDTTPDYEYENDNEGSVSRVESPLIAEGRDMDNVGSRKVKAYQYENEEVRPYFQEMARHMMYDLDNSTKGERIIIGDISQTGGGDFEYSGVKRNTTPDIADLLDNYNYTYADIRKGLKAIIEDHGAENIAVSKRIEFALDDRLRNGFTAVDGLKIPPNQEYIKLLNDKGLLDHLNSIPNDNIDEFDIFQKVDYNIDGIFISDASEYGSLQDTVKYLQSQNIIKKKGISYVENGNYWYAIKSNKFADFKPIARISIDGNEYLIDYVEREFNNGNYENAETIDSIIESIELENGTSNRNNANITERTSTTSNDRLYNQEQRYSNRRYDNGTNDGNYGQELENSSFFNDDFAPVDNRSLSIEQAPRDFDNGGPMIRVSPEMQKRTLNKPTETKNVNWEALEDTSKGEQQALVKKKLGETLEQRDVDWDSLDDTSNSKQKQYNTETGQLEDAIEKKTKKEIKEKLLRETGIMNASLDEANNISKFLMENTDPIRLQEMVFGRGLGTQINDMFFQKVKDNTSKKIRFQNKERAEIKNLGIKARSKESAAVQKYGEKQWVNEYGETVAYGDKELSAEFPDVKTQEKIKKASQIIRQKYDNYLDETNKVLTELGYDAIPKRQDYMRHFQELNDIFSRVGIPYNYNEMTANDLPTDINGLTHDFSPSKNFFANALRRTGNKTTYDAITGIDGYLEGIGNLIYHTEDIQRLRAYEQYIRDTYGQNHGFDNIETLSDEEKVSRIEKIQDNHLSNYASWLHEYTNTLAGKKSLVDRGVEHLVGRRIYSFLNTTKSQVGKNMIGFNIGSAMTNAIAGVQALAKTNKIASVKGLADTVKNVFRNDGFADKNNFLTSRFGSDSISKNWWQKVGDAGFIFMQGMDNFVSNFVVRSKYNELKSKGLSDEQAHIEAGKFASRLMSDRSQGAMPNLYNSQMLGIVTQFQNEVNNQLYSMFYDTYHESKESAQGKALKTTAGMTFTLGQLAVFTHIFGQAFEKMAGYNPTFDIIGILMKAFGFDDDEDSEDTVGDNLEQAFKQLGDALPYVNILTGGGRIPISEALPIQELFTGKDEYGNDKSRLKTLSEALPYYVLPTGFSQAKKTVQGLGMYDEDLPIAGSYTDSGNLRFTADESDWGKVQAGIFGRWANDEAQAYVDSEFKTINKSNIEELIDLGMKSSEYRKLKEKINKSGKKVEDKVDYIATLNELTDSQKNTLVNNILDRDYDVDVSNYEDYSSYDEFNFYYKNREKYDWLKTEGISYEEYSATDESKELYNYAYKYPETYKVGKAITGDFATYKEHADYIWDLKADKDENGDSISGTKKTKVISYVNSLDLSIPQKAMLIRKTYSSFDDYNNEIVDYVSNLDFDYDTKKTILEELDMTVYDDGTVEW